MATVVMALIMVGCADAPPEGAEQASEPDAALDATVAATAERLDDSAGSEDAGERGVAEGGEEHARSEGGGEHEQGGEHGTAGEGEESGVLIRRGEIWDATRAGARLVLSFESASSAFVGTVENTTREMLCAVRVEVHLSTGTELGPTERTDLPAGGSTAVELPTAGEDFETWTAHPEVSPCKGS